jgi:hypothetical protein
VEIKKIWRIFTGCIWKKVLAQDFAIIKEFALDVSELNPGKIPENLIQ